VPEHNFFSIDRHLNNNRFFRYLTYSLNDVEIIILWQCDLLDVSFSWFNQIIPEVIHIR